MAMVPLTMAEFVRQLLGAVGLVVVLASLLVGSAAVANVVVSRAARSGLRAAVALVVMFGMCGVMVRVLGLFGVLSAPWLLVSSLVLGVTVWQCVDRAMRFSEPFRLLGHTMWTAVNGPPAGSGRVALVIVVFLCLRSGLVEGIDSLSIHGPLIVDWIQSRTVPLLSDWNYPQTWECQFVPVLVFLGTDQMVVLPRLVVSLCLVVAVRENAGLCRVPGRIAWSAGWFFALSPLLWGLNRGEGAFKNDSAFALGLLLLMVAWRRQVLGVGRSWLLTIAALVLVVGTKPSGIVYAGMATALLAVTGTLAGMRNRGDKVRVVVREWVVLGVLLASVAAAAAPQVANLVVNENPVYPVKLKIGDVVDLPGVIDLTSTSVLSHWRELRTWRMLASGAFQRAGPDVVLVAILALAVAVVAWAPRRRRRTEGCDARVVSTQPSRLRWIGAWFVVLGTLYLATPWSRGHTPHDVKFLVNGLSLRYALAPLALATVLAVAVFPWRRIGARGAAVVAAAGVALVVARWRATLPEWLSLSHAESWVWLGAAVVTACLAGRAGRRPAHRLRPRLVAVMGGAVLVVVFLLCLETRREKEWGGDYHDVWAAVWRNTRASSSIAMSRRTPLFRYLLFGRHLENRLFRVNVSVRGLSELSDKTPLVFLQSRPRTPDRMERQITVLERAGWSEVARSVDGRSRLFGRADRPGMASEPSSE